MIELHLVFAKSSGVNEDRPTELDSVICPLPILYYLVGRLWAEAQIRRSVVVPGPSLTPLFIIYYYYLIFSYLLPAFQPSYFAQIL